MNQIVYEQLELSSKKKKLFIFVCSVNKPNSIPILDLIIKRAKIKHNNAFVNKKAQINYI